MPCGKCTLDVVERRVDLLGQLQRVRAGLLLNTDDDGGLRVVRAVAALDRGADLHRSEIAHQHGHRIVSSSPRSLRCRPTLENLPEAANQIFLTLGGRKPGGRIPVGRRQRALHIGNRHAV